MADDGYNVSIAWHSGPDSGTPKEESLEPCRHRPAAYGGTDDAVRPPEGRGRAGLLVLLLAILVAAPPFNARAGQPFHLFEYITLENVGDPDKPAIEAAVTAVEAKPATIAVYLVRLNTALLSLLYSTDLPESGPLVLDRNALAVSLRSPSGQLVEFDTLSIRRHSPSKLFLWGSRSEDVTTSFGLSVFDGRAIGNLDIGPSRFFLGHLAEDIHLMTQIDTSLYGRDDDVTGSK